MGKDQISDGKPKLKRKQYEKELRRLQAELCHLQEWVKLKGLRIMVVFEGRDGAGKGGTIRAITERVSPRVFRVVALPAHRTARSRRCMYSVTWSISLRRARSCSSTAVGTTALGWSLSWGFARKSSTADSSKIVRVWKNSSWTTASSSSSIGWKSAMTNKSAALKRVSTIRCASGS